MEYVKRNLIILSLFVLCLYYNERAADYVEIRTQIFQNSFQNSSYFPPGIVISYRHRAEAVGKADAVEDSADHPTVDS